MVFHSQLTKFLSNLIEKVQKKTLRAIYGYSKSYRDLFIEAALPSLEERRTEAVRKFTQKTIKNAKYGPGWFPERQMERHTRQNNPYTEELAHGNRLYLSPIFSMRRALNESEEDNSEDLTGLFNDPFLS